MNMTIDLLKDLVTQEPFYPLTHEQAVIDNNEVNLKTKLSKINNKIDQKVNDYSKMYLTFEALETGTISFNIRKNASTEEIVSISYSTNDGATWTTVSNTDNKQADLEITVNVAEGSKILWKGNAKVFACFDEEEGLDDYSGSFFSSTCFFNAYGNIMSLLYEDSFFSSYGLLDDRTFYCLFYDFTGNTYCALVDASNLILPATTLSENCYSRMFEGCEYLKIAPELPATTLAEFCYSNMFSGCLALEKAPELPATNLVYSCYSSMFYGCSMLKNTPILPATVLADYCYQMMFYNCRTLISVPELPAMTMKNACYARMFENCTSLTTAPTLPAATLTNSCYNGMFNGCIKLNYIKCLATNISASNCLHNWVSGVANLGTFVKADSMTSWTTGTSGIPSGWTVLTKQEYEERKLYIDIDDTDTTVPSGTYASITTAIANDISVVLRVTKTNNDNDIAYLPLVNDYNIGNTYYFNSIEDHFTYYCYISSNNLCGFLVVNLEKTSNKVTSLSSSSTDALYPSAKAVYDAILAADMGSGSGEGGSVTQVLVDWNQSDTTAVDYIKNKPSITTDINNHIIIGNDNIIVAPQNIFISDKKNSISLNNAGDSGIEIIANDGSDGTISLSASSTISLNTTGTNKAYYNNKEIAVKDDIKVTSVNGMTGAVTITETQLSKGTTTGSGNAVTDITVSGHTITLNKGTSFATLDSNGLVPANQLPSYVDDVIDGYMYGSEFFRPLVDGELKLDATSSDFTNDTKVTPVKNKIYFWVGNGHCYRWSGTEYVLIVASPGTTSNVPEGSNLYFTNARALAAVSTLLSGKADKAVPSAANNVALLDASGNLVDSGKTLGKSVPSTAVFTDVACNEQYHYTPSTADNASNIDLVPDGVLKIITGINLDSKKHIVSVTSGDLTKSMIGLNAVTNDRQVKGLSSGTTSGHIVTFGSDGYTIADSGVSVSDLGSNVLYIDVSDEDTTVPSGIYANITAALASGTLVILRVTMDTLDSQVMYAPICLDYTDTDNIYFFTTTYLRTCFVFTINSQNAFTSSEYSSAERGLPSVSSSDNNKILLVVNGSWTLVTPPAIYSGSTTPSSSLGSNGDIYIQTS